MGSPKSATPLPLAASTARRRTITLEWYKQLSEWHKIVRETELYGGMLEL